MKNAKVSRTKQSIGSMIENNFVEAAVGSYIVPDGRVCGEKLTEGDDFVDSGFPGCDFRFPIGGISQIAVNVHVTGRTYQYRGSERMVRVKIEWVGDCEASTHSYGFMSV